MVELTISSVNWFCQYANFKESKAPGMVVLMCVITILSKHFVTTGVSAMERKSFKQVTVLLFGRGTLVVDIKEFGH